MSAERDHRLVWVSGAGGLIGREIVLAADAAVSAGWEVCGLTRQDLDLDDPTAVARRLAERKPDLIIHCAALSRTGACEADPNLAHRLNVETSARLIDGAPTARFVFFSSDLVFDGRRGNYTDTDRPNPVNVYGRTKFAVESLLARHPNALVIRTSLNFGHSLVGDRSFNEEMVRAWRQNRPVKAFIDEYRCPIPASVTASVTWDLALSPFTGIVHVAGAERISRWEIADALRTHYPSLNPKVEPVTLKGFVGPPRSPDVSLNCEQLKRWLGCQLPNFRDWLQEHEPVHHD